MGAEITIYAIKWIRLHDGIRCAIYTIWECQIIYFKQLLKLRLTFVERAWVRSRSYNMTITVSLHVYYVAKTIVRVSPEVGSEAATCRPTVTELWR